MKDLIISLFCLIFALTISWVIPIDIAYNNISILTIIVFLIFTIHLIVFIPSYIFATEKYYDITGTISYLAVIIFINYNFYLSGIKLNMKSIFICLLISIWAVRLGTFLFLRVHRFKKDRRFDEAKKVFSKFLMYWMMSSLWVFLTTINGLVIILNNDMDLFGILFFIGLLLWSIGFIIELISDYQKYLFKLNKKNNFIKSGLWSISRHPNYLGEILLWFGVSIISLNSLSGFQYISLISPLFIYLLLTRISGINLLEEHADNKWGEDLEYIKYKNKTPVLFPSIPRKGLLK